MDENYALAAFAAMDLGRLASVCRVGDRDFAGLLLSEILCSFAVRAMPSGRPATLLVLTTVVQIFENFRYHAPLSQAPTMSPSNLAPISANGSSRASILSTFNEAGEMTEFEVMIRPIKALAALGEEMGNGSARNWPTEATGRRLGLIMLIMPVF